MHRDLIGLAEENVLIRAGACSVSVLPRLGGKIASIQVDGRELLQTPLAPLAPRTRTMTFDAGDASGWDECLPSVGACTVSTQAGPAEIPDHGDLWRVEWQRQGPGTRDQGLRDLRNFQFLFEPHCSAHFPSPQIGPTPATTSTTGTVAKTLPGAMCRLRQACNSGG